MQNHQSQPSDAGAAHSHKAVLNERELRRVSNFIGSEVDIQLPASKRTLVEGRLRKRLRALGYSDFKSYLDHTLESEDGELERLQHIDVIHG